MRYVIYFRVQAEVNTDPERRCYNGCHASSEMQWTAWAPLEECIQSRVEARLTFWKELNDYAVKERGESARREFKVVKGGTP